MKALILYNPAAGRIPVSPFVHNAAKVLSRLGWDVDVEATQSGTQATGRAQQAAGQVEAVFAVGGDGTVGQIASGLAGSQTALGILPAGTMNVLGMEIGLQPFAWTLSRSRKSSRECAWINSLPYPSTQPRLC
jgi:diacylglycerol kinase (ATP)